MKTIGICLLIIAGLMIWGLSDHWKFADWQTFDWVIVIFNIIAGIYILLQKENQ